MEKKDEKTAKSRTPQEILSGLWKSFRKLLRNWNAVLQKVYNPNRSAALGAFIVFVIAVFLLFIPPYIGTADDGALTMILENAGLGYRLQDLEAPVGSYFIRLFLHSTRIRTGVSSHVFLIRIAMFIDNIFTGDNLFDVRFLSGLYLILYMPAVWLFIRGIVNRVNYASEALFLTILCAVVLADGSILCYFNSLYPEAFWQILLVYCFGFILAFQHGKDNWNQIGFFGLMVAGTILILTECHCAAAGLVLMLFCLRQITMTDGTSQTIVFSVMSAGVLLVASIFSWTIGTSRFDNASKLHSMTTGVLLRSLNPETTLKEFGIDPRYETLTDISSYADYPYATFGNPEIQEGFLDQYGLLSVILYYLRHPFAYTGLLEIGTNASFNIIRAYVGNYEQSLGLPERARNPLFIVYSNLKASSLPRTLGFIVLLAVIYMSLFRTRTGYQKHAVTYGVREKEVMIDTFITAIVMGIASITVIILKSGTAELERYQMTYGFCIDVMILLLLAEVLHRLNILSIEED